MKRSLITIILFLVLIFSNFIAIKYALNLQDKLDIEISNAKAYNEECSQLQNRILEYKMDISYLNYSKDSLVIALNKVRNELNIKDKDLKRLEYLSSTVRKTDTVYIKDTLFIDKDLYVDTTISDKWSSLKLTLEFPNKITVSPTFKSEKYIITHYKKETVNPPKKCAIGRLFQRKHKVLEVEIIENNPYIINDKQKFIEIIK